METNRAVKRLVFSGFSRADEADIRKIALKLNSDILMKNPDDLFPKQTDFVVFDNFGSTEKVEAALALGIPIVKKQYVLDSAAAGHWLPELDEYDIGNPRVEAEKKRRNKFFIKPLKDRKSLKEFQNIHAVVLVENQRRKKVLQNLIKLGGGEVYHWTAYHLKDSSPEDRGRIKHIFAEPAMILNDIFYKFMEDNAAKSKIPLLSPVYLKHFLTKGGEYWMDQYSILNLDIIKLNKYSQEILDEIVGKRTTFTATTNHSKMVPVFRLEDQEDKVFVPAAALSSPSTAAEATTGRSFSRALSVSGGPRTPSLLSPPPFGGFNINLSPNDLVSPFGVTTSSLITSSNGPPDPDIYSPAAPSPSSVGSADPRLRKHNSSSQGVDIAAATAAKRRRDLAQMMGSSENSPGRWFDWQLEQQPAGFDRSIRSLAAVTPIQRSPPQANPVHHQQYPQELQQLQHSQQKLQQPQRLKEPRQQLHQLHIPGQSHRSQQQDYPLVGSFQSSPSTASSRSYSPSPPKRKDGSQSTSSPQQPLARAKNANLEPIGQPRGSRVGGGFGSPSESSNFASQSASSSFVSQTASANFASQSAVFSKNANLEPIGQNRRQEAVSAGGLRAKVGQNTGLEGLLNPSYLNAANNVIEVDDNDDSSNEMNHQKKSSPVSSSDDIFILHVEKDSDYIAERKRFTQEMCTQNAGEQETVCLIETESPTMSPQPASPSYDPEDVVCPRSPEKPVVLPPPASPGTPWCPNRDPFDDSRPAPRAVNPTPEFRPLEPFWNGPPSPSITFSSDSFWEEVRKLPETSKEASTPEKPKVGYLKEPWEAVTDIWLDFNDPEANNRIKVEKKYGKEWLRKQYEAFHNEK